MSLYGSDDYEPSQLDNLATSTGWESPPVRRSTRVSTAGGRNSEFFDAGGALDSQTTDSQYVDALYVPDGLDAGQHLDTKDTGVQTDGSGCCACDTTESLQGCRTCDSLRAQLEIMQAAYNALEERLEQARGILSDPIDVLDPTEQSQVILNLQDFRCTGDASDWYPSSASYGGCEGGILGRSRRRIQEGAEDGTRSFKKCKQAP